MSWTTKIQELGSGWESLGATDVISKQHAPDRVPFSTHLLYLVCLPQSQRADVCVNPGNCQVNQVLKALEGVITGHYPGVTKLIQRLAAVLLEPNNLVQSPELLP